VIHEAQLIPEVGQAFEAHGFSFEVVGKEGNRVTRVRIRPQAEGPAEAPAAGS